jgi:biopolymer transport protein TolR
MPSTIGRGRGRRTINEINMVPFIDVMLVLLIIFMVTAPLITPSMIDLPSVGKAAKQPDQIIQVILGKTEGVVEVKVKDQSTSLPLKELAAAVRSAQGAKDSAAAANSAVVISADKNVKYESVVKVMDTLQRAGIARVGLSVQLVN